MPAIHYGPNWWDTSGPFPKFRMPVGTLGAISLRSHVQRGIPVISQGGSILVMPTRDDRVGRFLGDDLDGPVSLTERQAFGIELRIGGQAISSLADTPRKLITELLTQHGDPTRQARWGPLTGPTISWRLGGFSECWREPYDPVRHPLVLAKARADYHEARVRTAQGVYPSDSHRRYLSFLKYQYGRWWNWEEIKCQCSDCPPEPPLPTRTKFTDDFSGNLDDWTQDSGSWNTTGGNLQIGTAGGDGTSEIHHTTDQDTTNHYSQAKITEADVYTGEFVAMAVRILDEDNWFAAGTQQSSTDDDVMEQRVTGTRSDIAGPTSRNWIDGNVGKFLAGDGGNDNLDFESPVDTNRLSTTDTDHGSEKSVGMFSDSSGDPAAWDDWEGDEITGGENPDARAFIPRVMVY